MRILHVVSGDLYAGAERVVEELSIAQSALPRTHVVVAVMNEGLLADRLRAAGVVTTVLNERYLSVLRLFSALRGLIKKHRIQVVHTHRFKEDVLGAFASKGLAKSLRTVHGAPEFRRSGMIRDRLIVALDRFSAIHLQEKIVCVATELQERLRGRYGDVEPSCILNGIDRSRLLEDAAVPVPSLDGEVRIGIFARLVPVKRIDIAIEVAKQLRGRLGASAILHIFGDGPLQEELRRQSSGDDGIAFHGNTRVAPAYMRQMHALLLTSEHEGLPVSVLEAMALQVPVVVTRIGGLPNLLANGSCGWLVEFGAVDSYAQALVEATQPGAVRAAKVAAALARSESEFSARRMAEDYQTAYHSMATVPCQTTAGT